jgi:hypothetical protein
VPWHGRVECDDVGGGDSREEDEPGGECLGAGSFVLEVEVDVPADRDDKREAEQAE